MTHACHFELSSDCGVAARALTVRLLTVGDGGAPDLLGLRGRLLREIQRSYDGLRLLLRLLWEIRLGQIVVVVIVVVGSERKLVDQRPDVPEDTRRDLFEEILLRLLFFGSSA